MLVIATLANSGAGYASAAEIGAVETGRILEEIIVTASKRETSLGRVPISVAAFTAESMDRRGIRNIEDIALITPGVKFSESSFGGNTSTDISIRGIQTDSGASTTGIYIDEVPIQARQNIQTTFGTGYPYVFDLERVEVLRGPQGTLYGAGSQGGTVRFITPTPSATDTELYGRGEYAATSGGEPVYEAGVAVNLPVVDNVVGLRGSVWRRKQGGWVDRAVLNATQSFGSEESSDTNSAEIEAAKIAFMFQANDRLRVIPSIFYQSYESDDTSTLWSLISDPDDGDFYNGAAASQPSEDEYLLSSITANYQLEKAELVSVTSHFDREGSGAADYTNLNTAFLAGVIPPVPFLPGQSELGETGIDQENISQEIRLSSIKDDSSIDWTVGAFYTKMEQSGFTNVDGRDTASYFPIELVFGIPLTEGRYIFTSANDSTEKQWALFGQADWHVTDEISVMLGLRYSEVEFEYTRTVGAPLNYPGFGPEIQATTGMQKDNPVTPKIGLTYEPTDDDLYYMSASKGFRTGGVNPPLFRDPQTGDSCSPIPVPETYGPDELWSYEIGAKNRFLGGSVRTEASAFYIQWDDIQQFVNPGGCAGNGFRDNLGSATSKGIELSFNALLTDELSLTGAVGYLDAEFDKTISSPAGIIVSKGDSLDITPWQLSLMIEYLRPLGSYEVYANAAYQYGSHNDGNDKRHNPQNLSYDPDLDFDPATRQTNARVGLRINKWDFSIFASNLTDEAPVLSKDHDVAGSSLYYYRTFRPRTFGLTVTYR